MKHLKIYEEWKFKNPFKSKPVEEPIDDVKLAQEAIDAIAVLNEENNDIIRIKNLIDNGDFISMIQNEKTFKIFEDYEIILNDTEIVKLIRACSMGPGKDGWELDNGDYADACIIILNGKRMGDQGYVTWQTFHGLIKSLNDEKKKRGIL